MLCSDCTDVRSETSFTLEQYFPEEYPLFSKLLKEKKSNQVAQGRICNAIFVSTLKLSINLNPFKKMLLKAKLLPRKSWRK